MLLGVDAMDAVAWGMGVGRRDQAIMAGSTSGTLRMLRRSSRVGIVLFTMCPYILRTALSCRGC